MPRYPSTSPRSRADTPSWTDYTVAFRTTRPTWTRRPSSGACRTTGASARTGTWCCPARIVFRYSDPNEVYTAGDAYYGAPGHLPLLFTGTQLVEFSPTGALNETMTVVGRASRRPGRAVPDMAGTAIDAGLVRALGEKLITFLETGTAPQGYSARTSSST